MKKACFNTLICPILEYASCIWDPHKQTHIDRLEKIQKRAARFITTNRKFAHGNTYRNTYPFRLVPPSVTLRKAQGHHDLQNSKQFNRNF